MVAVTGSASRIAARGRSPAAGMPVSSAPSVGPISRGNSGRRLTKSPPAAASGAGWAGPDGSGGSDAGARDQRVEVVGAGVDRQVAERQAARRRDHHVLAVDGKPHAGQQLEARIGGCGGGRARLELQIEAEHRTGGQALAAQPLDAAAIVLLGGQRLVGERAAGERIDAPSPFAGQRGLQRRIHLEDVLVLQGAVDGGDDAHGPCSRNEVAG